MQGQLLFGTETAPPVTAVKPRKNKTEKPRKVSRGKGLKRHPSRPPVVKRVVKSKPVSMQAHPGIIGEIVDRDEDFIYVVWPGKGDRVYAHNARYMVSVDLDKE